MTDSTGAIVGEDRFYPFGETRFTTGTMFTDKLFTGQREMAGLGIYHYGARFYSPKLGRFLSADSIVPGYANPQNLNRYSYVINNPLRYTDPTGHMMADAKDGGKGKPCPSCIQYVQQKLKKNSGGGGGGSSGGGGGGSGGTGSGSLPPAANDPTCGSGNYSPKCAGWHFYTTTNVVCPAYLHCTTEEMKDYFLRFAYPGQDPSQPVVDDKIYNVGLCINDRCISMGKYGAIRVDVSEDGFTTTNTTDPSHILYDGKVVRHLYQGDDGAWYVSSYGSGNNTTVNLVTPGPPPGLNPPNTVPVSLASLNDWMGPGIFNNGDYQIFQTIILNQ